MFNVYGSSGDTIIQVFILYELGLAPEGKVD